MNSDYIEYEGVVRKDEDGDDIGPLVRVHFTAGGYQTYVRATWESPAEGGMFEDIRLVRVEIDPRSMPCEPLTGVEQALVRDWFDTDEAQDRVQRAATKLLREWD